MYELRLQLWKAIIELIRLLELEVSGFHILFQVIFMIISASYTCIFNVFDYIFRDNLAFVAGTAPGAAGEIVAGEFTYNKCILWLILISIVSLGFIL